MSAINSFSQEIEDILNKSFAVPLHKVYNNAEEHSLNP